MSFPPSHSTSAQITAQNRFGLALVQQVAQAAGTDNVFLSPLGVLAALALAMGGAAGATRAAFAKTLFGDALASEEMEETLANQLRKLSQAKDGDAVLSIASSIWADHHFTLASTFVERAHALYQADAATLDFLSPDAASTINAWAHRQTNGRVPEIVSAETLVGPPPASVVLLNAVYFLGCWEQRFNPTATKLGLFLQADGTVQKVPFMQQVSSKFGYLAGDGWQAVALPYEGWSRSSSMLVFLPDEYNGMPAFLATLDASRWATWYTALCIEPEPVEVELTLPRFQLKWSGNLVSTLKAMGLADAFSLDADFSPLGFQTKDGGFIDAILHQTFLAVDEKGTEAAAVTAMVAMQGARFIPRPPRRVEVRVDSPFFCAIVDTYDGAILFAGTVCNLA
ncbi:serpin family protein [Hymenobacter terrenus]|uniref:serpin family protein n=1 Tax=Hymenobacter terrenus TaxID=1629124 RepID=UPI0006190CA3|nr:serpin family protein [Hymenobacter terrenus]